MDTKFNLTTTSQDKVTVQARYDALAEKYLHNYLYPTSLFGLEKQRRLQILQEYLQDSRPASVLDLGCGPGYVTSQISECLPDAEIMGIDFSSEMIRFARKNYGAQASFFQGDAEDLPFNSEKFSTVYALGVLGKFKSLQQVLVNINRVLQTKGTFFFTYPNKESWARYMRKRVNSLRSIDGSLEHVLLNERELITHIKEFGFEIKERKYITYGNSYIFFPWTQRVNLSLERLLKYSKIGHALAFTTMWNIRKT